MPGLSSLRYSLQQDISNPRVQADGYCLWLVWQGEENPLVAQTMEEYGGVRIADEEQQALWFFFSSDACLAVARLGVWSRFNSISTFVELFPARLLIGQSISQKKIIIDESIWSQKIEGITAFQIWVHSAIYDTVTKILGISLEKKELLPGMSEGQWSRMAVDPRLPYQPMLGWHVLIKPLGNSHEKSFIVGWHACFSHLDVLLQRNKFRFVTNGSFVMFSVDGLGQLRSLCRDLLIIFDHLEKVQPQDYWPCVVGIVDRQRLNLNAELPEKSGLNWEQLAPDFPHMSVQNALMMGEDFLFQVERNNTDENSIAAWCSISLREKMLANANYLPSLVPAFSLGSNPHCFYCGQHSHLTADCPTRKLSHGSIQIWNRFGQTDISVIHDMVKKLDRIYAEHGDEGIQKCFFEDPPEAIFIGALLDISWSNQLRAAELFWCARDKNLRTVNERNRADVSPAWSALETFIDKVPGDREKELASLSASHPNDFRIFTLRGFDAIERGNCIKAMEYWKQAEVLSSYPVIAVWHLFLQARCHEYQHQYQQAKSIYEQIARLCPTWTFVAYRKLVCDIKGGFSHLALPALEPIIKRDGNYFNKALIDPELERGFIQVQAYLNKLWGAIQDQARSDESTLLRMQEDLSAWFIPDNAFAVEVKERLQSLLQARLVNNYVSLQSLLKKRTQISIEIQEHIDKEAVMLRETFKKNRKRLQYIWDEAAWFPFPKILTEFNRQYRECTASLAWALEADFDHATVFKKAQHVAEQQKERITYLEGRMKFLRITRDATLFVLSLVETFFWVELAGIIVVFVILPLLLVYGDKIGLEWTVSFLSQNRFEVQKVLLLLVSLFAFSVASLRVALRFDAIRAKVLQKARKPKKKKKGK